MRLHGRSDESARIASLLEAARTGAGGTLVLSGEPGIGKTSLLRWAESSAPGLRVLAARGLESETELAFAGLGDLLRPILSRLEQIPPRQAAALAGALAVGPPAPGDRFAVAAATLSLLSTASEEEPLLLLVDDAHWLDGPSLQALLFAARRIHGQRIALVLAVRPGFTAEALEVLAVDGLERQPALDLLAETRDINPTVAEELVDATGGNPLGLLELSAQLTREQLSGAEPALASLPAAPAVAAAFLRRVQALPDETRGALIAAAAADSDDLDALSPVLARLGVSPGALAAAQAAGLVRTVEDRIEFRHPLVRSLLLAEASPQERRAVHAAHAEALVGPDELERRAAHLAEAATAPDEALAETLEAAAERALERGGYAAAAKTLRRAADLTPDPERRSRRLLRAAQGLRFAGELEAALETLEEALATAKDPLHRAEIHHLRVRVATASALPLDGGLSLSAVAESIVTRDPTRAALLFAHSAQLAAFSGDPSSGLELARRSRELLPARLRADDLETLVLLGQVFVLAGDRSEALATTRRFATTLERAPEETSEAALLYASLLFWLEQYEAGRSFLKRQIGSARAAGALGVLPRLLDTLAALDARGGRWVQAYADSSEALQLARETADARQTASSLTTLARIEAGQGKADDCRAHAAEAIELARRLHDRVAEAWALCALGVLELGLGRAEAAIAEFERLRVPVGEPANLHDSGALIWTADLVEAYVRARRPDDARRLLEAEPGNENGSAWEKGAFARARALLVEPAALDEAFAGALRAHERAGIPFELARTELCYGERLRRARRRTESRTPLRSALATFEQLGALPWAKRARKELEAAGEFAGARPRNTRIASLTPQELQVALLVAEGATNREVATALFVSPKTIEAHLSRAYAKLGVRSRTELARVLPADGTPSARRSSAPQPEPVGRG